MTDVTRWGVYPQEALDAAAAELGRQCHGGPADPDDIKLASDVLGVAAPVIQAAERDRIGAAAVPGRDAIAALLRKWLGTPDWEALNVADKIIELGEGGSDGD